jgi:hypothetical protein
VLDRLERLIVVDGVPQTGPFRMRRAAPKQIGGDSAIDFGRA